MSSPLAAQAAAAALVDETARAAAAGLVEDVMNDPPQMVTDLAGVHPPQIVGAGDLLSFAKQTQPEQPNLEVAEPTAPVAEPELPAWEADLDGIEDLLDEPDYEVEDDDEPVQAAEPLETSEYDDPEVAKLKKQLLAAQKQIQHEKQLRVKNNLKSWQAEAARRFPLADAEEIDGSSRRAVLRKAQEQHNRYARKLKPFTDVLDGLKQQAVAEVKTQARQEAEQAWGKPVTGVTVPQVAQSDDTAAVDPRRFRSPHELIAEKLKRGLYGPI